MAWAGDVAVSAGPGRVPRGHRLRQPVGRRHAAGVAGPRGVPRAGGPPRRPRPGPGLPLPPGGRSADEPADPAAHGLPAPRRDDALDVRARAGRRGEPAPSRVGTTPREARRASPLVRGLGSVALVRRGSRGMTTPAPWCPGKATAGGRGPLGVGDHRGHPAQPRPAGGGVVRREGNPTDRLGTAAARASCGHARRALVEQQQPARLGVAQPHRAAQRLPFGLARPVGDQHGICPEVAGLQVGRLDRGVGPAGDRGDRLAGPTPGRRPRAPGSRGAAAPGPAARPAARRAPAGPAPARRPPGGRPPSAARAASTLGGVISWPCPRSGCSGPGRRP